MSNVRLSNAGTKERLKATRPVARPTCLPDGQTVLLTLTNSLWEVYYKVLAESEITESEFIEMIYEDTLTTSNRDALTFYADFQNGFRIQLQVMRSGYYESKRPAANRNGVLTNVKHVQRSFSLTRIFQASVR